MAVVNSGPCDISELLIAYLDGELRPGELERVVEHLGDCLDCIVEFHELKETRAALRSLPLLEAPDTILASVHFSAELSAYLDGELPTVEHRLVFDHVHDCQECRHELYELDAARTAVRSLPGLDPPGFLDLRRARRAERRYGRATRVAAALASVAAASLLVVSIRSSADPSAGSVDLDSFADRHVARVSLEPGFQVVPAVSPGGLAP